MINLSAINSRQVYPAATPLSTKKPATVSVQSFAGQLSYAVAAQKVTPKAPPPTSVQSQKIVARQTCATASKQADTVVLSPAASKARTAPSMASPADETPAQPGLTGFAALAAVYGSPTVSQAVPAPQSADTGDSVDDAYWAQQPAAVQQLRNISDPDQRTALATQLAGEGYTIDVPIMVWGWDPAKVTQLRQSFGYTWVPSAMQTNVAAAPGISGPGIMPYDPNNPPAGSIAV